jgi:hypothetical protein
VLPAVLGALGIIWCLHDRPELLRLHGLLGSRPLVFVGKISYSLYLWHWPVFVLFRWTVGLESPTTRILAIGLAFVLAIASWRFVENPIRYSRRVRRLPETAVIAGSLSIVALAAGVATGIGANEHRLSISTVSRNPEIWYPNVVAADPEAPGCTAEPERRNVAGGRLYVYAPSGCVNPRPMAAANIYVIGDSHAAAYEGLFKRYAIRHATRISVYANGGCSFISLQPWRDLDDAQCRHRTEAALDDLRKTLKPGDVLFMPSLRLQRLSTQWSYLGEEPARTEMFGLRAERGRRRSVNYAVATLRELTERGALVIIEAPKPLFKAPPFRCADWFNRHNPVCDPGFTVPRTLLDTFRQPVLDSLAEIARRVPGVSIWDPYAVLCPQEPCRAWLDGKPLFLDGDHLSGYGNAILLPSFTAAVKARGYSQ